MRRSTTKRAGCNNVPVLRRNWLANHTKVVVSCPLPESKMEACFRHILLKNIKCNSLVSFVFYDWQWWKVATLNRHVLILGFIHHEWWLLWFIVAQCTFSLSLSTATAFTLYYSLLFLFSDDLFHSYRRLDYKLGHINVI